MMPKKSMELPSLYWSWGSGTQGVNEIQIIFFCNWTLIKDLAFVGAAMKEYSGLGGRPAGTEAKSGSCFSWSSLCLVGTLLNTQI